jgi:hypothetical protein
MTPVDDQRTAQVGVLAHLQSTGIVPDLARLVTWDLGCGTGVFARAMLSMGAKLVLASDLELPPINDPCENVVWVNGNFDAADDAIGGLSRIDFVLMHLMSEHVHGLKDFLIDLYARLRPGAQVVIHHDNYFQPVGHHDHGLIALDGATWIVEPVGKRCWESAQKCAASADHREKLATKFRRLWSAGSEATRDPLNCDGCNYFRRSQPWAHLIYGSDLRRTFPEDFFRTNLNRLSPAQVVWDVQDAGFAIVKEQRSWIMNPPPADLVRQYGADNLQTFTITLRLARL